MDYWVWPQQGIIESGNKLTGYGDHKEYTSTNEATSPLTLEPNQTT